MRRSLHILTLIVFAWLVFLTAEALVGPHKLPSRIPTHFDAAGDPNDWSGPQTLLGLPFGALVLYGILTLVERRPESFHFNVTVTADKLPRLQALAIDMIAWLRLEVVLLFTWIQSLLIAGARSSHSAPPPAFLPVVLGVLIATIAVYVVQFRRAAK